MTVAKPALHFRLADKGDINQLVEIENRCFTLDKLRARNFLWLLEKGHCNILVVEVDGGVTGYSLLLYRRGTSLARLYSVAILPEYRGRGMSVALLEKSELLAREHNCVYLRLEVRADNHSAIALYERLGYRQFSTKADYYEDHSLALCFEKRIIYPQPVSSS